MKSICVYCGSSTGNSIVHSEAARSLAQEMVSKGISLIYGGGNVGLMGIIADEVLRLGGEAIGVIPDALMEKEVGHRGLTRLHVVKDMHERKAMMAELSDGFIALPGGIGTLEELFETLTWAQLGLHDKPVGLLNVEGFYDGLLVFLDHLVKQGFLKTTHAGLMLQAARADALIERFKSFTPSTQTGVLDKASAQSLLP